MANNNQNTQGWKLIVLVLLGIVCWFAPNAWKSWIIIAMLVILFHGGSNYSQSPSIHEPINPPPAISIQGVKSSIHEPINPLPAISIQGVKSSIHEPINLLPAISIQGVESSIHEPINPPPVRGIQGVKSFIHEPINSLPFIKYEDVYGTVKDDALQEAKEAVIEGLRAGQSIDAIQSFAYNKALYAAKETNRRFGNLLKATEISVIASTAAQEALIQNNDNKQQA